MVTRRYRFLLIFVFIWGVTATLLLGGCSSSSDDTVTEPAPGSNPDDIPPPGSNPDTDPPPGSNPDTDPPPGSNPDTDPPPGSNPSLDPMSETARYSLTFNASWSGETHPLNFPGNPHFSGLTGAVHNNQIIFWELGQIATDGIELMAETGGSSTLLTEVAAAIADGKASADINGGGVGVSPGNVGIEFSVSRDYPLMTVTSMLAPSPDWFVGVNSLSMLSDDGAFIDQLTVDLSLYDAGTDSGLQYASSNEGTQPRETITALTTDPSDTPFVNGQPAVGQFVIQRIE